MGGRAPQWQPLHPIISRGRSNAIRGEICETFTTSDGVWDGSADLDWTITAAVLGDLQIISNELTMVCDSMESGVIGAATTPDYGITSADCWAEFDITAIGDDNYPTRAVSDTAIIIGLRADAGWDRNSDDNNDDAIDLVIEIFGSLTSSFAGPSWFYYVYDGNSVATPIDESGTEIEGTPIGHWRYEIEGDEVRLYLDDALLNSGTDGALGDYGRNVGVASFVIPEVTPPTDTRGPTIDNLCAGNL